MDYHYLAAPALFIALMYAVVQFFLPQQAAAPPEAAALAEQECSPGETVPCITPKGCSGHRPCRLGTFGDCIPDYECMPGEVGSCPFNVCIMGTRECDECGRWGSCTAPRCDAEYCALEDAT